MFNARGLFTASGIFNASSYGIAPALHTYHTTDAVAEVTAPDYFPDFFDTDPLDIRADDILFLQCGDFNLITLIESVDPVNLVQFINFPTNIVTDNTQLLETDASGPWASPQSISIDVYNANKLCILTFPSIVEACTVAANTIEFTGTLPANLFPAYQINNPINVLDNSSYVEGAVQLNTDGTFFIEKLNSVAFTTTANAGYAGFSVVYKTI